MKRRILMLCSLVFLIALSAPADESDDTLKHFLSKSDCVVLGAIVSKPIGLSTESGVVVYICDFKISEVLKGNGLTNGITTKVSIERFVQSTSDQHPLIKEGSECILFLKNAKPHNIPKLQTADYWFGIQYPSSSLVHSIKRIAQKP